MGLETGTGIGDLVPTNPLSTDAVSAGDDHIRLIKTVMQSITGNFRSIVTFTDPSGPNVWTRPAGIKKILIYCLGQGGGGGGGTVNLYSGGGGGGGSTAIKWLDVSAIASAQVLVGGLLSGAGGAIGNPGLDGSDSYFLVGGTSYVCVAAGGKAGTTYLAGGISKPASASTGDIRIPGGCGAYGAYAVGATQLVFGANGGGAGGTNSTAAAANSGGGGGGGAAHATAQHPGAAGGTGLVVIFEFGW